MPPWQRRLFWFGMGVCALSGASYCLGHTLGWISGRMGSHLVLIAHGLSAGWVTYVLGILSISHIRVGWRLRRNTASGVANLLLLTLLVITGWALYYGPAETRDLTVQSHWLLGWVLVLVLGGHVLPRGAWSAQSAPKP